MRAEPGSRIGVNAILREAPAWCTEGVITMACGAEGYAGLVRLEDQRLNIAAALAPSAVASHRGPGAAVSALLRAAGVPHLEGLDRAEWRGVPALSRRRRRVAAERVFVLGDSAGYVEPFTGEGMTWAIASGLAVAPLAIAGIERWEPALSAQWERRYRRLIVRRQGPCRILSRVLRSPALTAAGIRLVSWCPGMVSACLR
jgi:flavin-dependent dehydrogenase